MELAPFVTLRKALSVLRLASAILPKILGSLWHGIGEQFHLHTSKRLAWIWYSQNQDECEWA